MRITFKLREKLILITVSTIILAVSLIAYLGMVDFAHVYKEAVIERVFFQFQPLQTTINDILELGLELNELEGINEECKRLVAEIHYAQYCFVTDNKGKVHYHISSKEVGSVYTDLVTQTALKSEKREAQYYKLDSGEKIYDFSLPIYKSTGERIGLIRLGVQSGVVDAQIYQLIRRSVVSGIFLTFIASIIVFLLFKRAFLESIRRLMQGITKFGRGELGTRVKLKTKDEIGELANSFNKMAESTVMYIDKRKEMERELKNKNEELENKNEELERFNKLTVGRELKMIELKKEIRKLKEKGKYHSSNV